MATPGQERARQENLKRGRTGPDVGAAGRAAAAEVREKDQAIRDAAANDPDDAILEMFQEASVAAARGLRKWNRSGGEPSRQTIDGVKEARQLAIVAGDILRTRGSATEAERFFAQMATRISAANLGEGPQPVVPSEVGGS